MTTTTLTTQATQATQAFGRLVLRGERAFVEGAGDAVLLVAIAAGSAIALISLLAPAF